MCVEKERRGENMYNKSFCLAEGVVKSHLSQGTSWKPTFLRSSHLNHMFNKTSARKSACKKTELGDMGYTGLLRSLRFSHDFTVPWEQGYQEVLGFDSHFLKPTKSMLNDYNLGRLCVFQSRPLVFEELRWFDSFSSY